MAAPDELYVDPHQLLQHSGQLAQLRADVDAVADVLAQVTADTGRRDSDEAGSSVPLGAAYTLREFAARLADDSRSVQSCAVTYVDGDLNGAARLNQLTPEV